MERMTQAELGDRFLLQTLNARRSIIREAAPHIKQFITGSRYIGTWSYGAQRIEGFGVYAFPDGSIYQGFWENGKFNGMGTLCLAAPYDMTFKGIFRDGVFHEAHEIIFNDGLVVHAKVHGNQLDFSEWTYCSSFDRRYAKEINEGIPPVGPNSNLTSKEPKRHLEHGEYDVGEGAYNPNSGFMMNRSPPFPPQCFMKCSSDDWIKMRCRVKSSEDVRADVSTCHNIINTNLKNELELEEYASPCNYEQQKLRKQYFAKLCPGEEYSYHSDIERDTPTTDSNNDSNAKILRKNLFEVLVTTTENEKQVFGRFPEAESVYLFNKI